MTETADDRREALSPAPLMDLAMGFWAFKTLAAAHELDLFRRLSGGPGVSVESLAKLLDIDERPAEMLLTGCSALGLLVKRDGRYHNAPLAEAFLVPGKPDYFGGYLRLADKRLYPGWARLTEAIKTNRPTTWDPDKQDSLFDGEDPEVLAGFWDAMHALSTVTARALGNAFDFGRFHRLLDIGGGSGAYGIELTRLYPHLRATVYDLPFVTEIAAANVRKAGLADRIETAGGNFFDDPAFPEGHDVALLSMILHDWKEDRNVTLLRKCHAALPAGGAVIISELLVNDDKTGPKRAALMSLNMLIETEGRNYTPAEYTTWLRDVGFRDVHTIWFEAPGANGAVIGYKA